VRDEQVLLNDLYYAALRGPDQPLATDGYYGRHTAEDVASFNAVLRVRPFGGTTTPNTWSHLCGLDWEHGFRGAYYHAAGCSLV